MRDEESSRENDNVIEETERRIGNCAQAWESINLCNSLVLKGQHQCKLFRKSFFLLKIQFESSRIWGKRFHSWKFFFCLISRFSRGVSGVSHTATCYFKRVSLGTCFFKTARTITRTIFNILYHSVCKMRFYAREASGKREKIFERKKVTETRIIERNEIRTTGNKVDSEKKMNGCVTCGKQSWSETKLVLLGKFGKMIKWGGNEVGFGKNGVRWNEIWNKRRNEVRGRRETICMWEKLGIGKIESTETWKKKMGN